MDFDGDNDQSPPAVCEEVVHTRVNSKLVNISPTLASVNHTFDPTGESLIAQVSSMESITPDALTPVLRPRRASVNRPAAPEKLLRERRNRTMAPSAPGGGHEQTDTSMVEITPISSGYGIDRSQGPRHETDGGVRLAVGRGGRVVADDSDRHSAVTSHGSDTLPPPYSSHFGEI